MKAKELSFEEANAVFRYDPETGYLWWKERGYGRTMSSPTGSLDVSTGYIRVRLNGTLFLAHRIAYLLYYGGVPSDTEVDHVNHITRDNRITNLRLVSVTENNRNLSKNGNNTTGVTGVSYHRATKKYVARIGVCGKRKCLGYFNTTEEAAAAREEANELYGYHKNHGKQKES